jgi:flagellar basal-body rod protein FlgB
MFLETSFGKTMDIMQRSMDVELLRRKVISDNIANSDTPNFKRSTVNFESQLRRALESENMTMMKAHMTHERHIPFERPVNYREVAPKRVLDYLTSSKNNGNNVDIEEEMMLGVQNQLRYQLLSQSVSNQFSAMNMVLRQV